MHESPHLQPFVHPPVALVAETGVGEFIEYVSLIRVTPVGPLPFARFGSVHALARAPTQPATIAMSCTPAFGSVATPLIAPP